ncbi:transposase [Candidatus Poribacteria bacterium]|nr:transposase [Candidatus Poribacteria bacterium]MYA54943.1 transposase [Candidatus Poribacteria bacterium]
MRKRRKFIPEFKAKVVLEALRKETSHAELCQRYNLSEDQLSKWKRQLLENAETLFQSTQKPPKEEQQRIAHLEKQVRKLRVAIDIHKKAEAFLNASKKD